MHACAWGLNLENTKIMVARVREAQSPKVRF